MKGGHKQVRGMPWLSECDLGLVVQLDSIWLSLLMLLLLSPADAVLS